MSIQVDIFVHISNLSTHDRVFVWHLRLMSKDMKDDLIFNHLALLSSQFLIACVKIHFLY
jgi:hypothetical protein